MEANPSVDVGRPARFQSPRGHGKAGLLPSIGLGQDVPVELQSRGAAPT